MTIRSPRARIGVTAAALTLGLGLAVTAAAPSGADTHEHEIYLVQGLPGVEADVSLDGDTVATDVGTGEVIGPFDVADDAEIALTDDDGTLLEATVTPEGASSDVVAHLPAADGDPLLTVFPNDLEAVPADKGGVSVTHTAVVPPADVVVDGQVLFANIANGESLELVVPAGDYTVEIVPAGEDGPVVLGPADLEVPAGELTKVYAVGDPERDTMTLAVHRLGVDATGTPVPDVVDTGVPQPWLAAVAQILAIVRAA